MKIAKRDVLVFGLFLIEALCYLDRVALSTAVLALSDELRLSALSSGLLLGAFFFGYAFGQLPGAMLAAYFGGHTVLCVATLLWSLLTLVFPFLPFALMLCSRVLLGLCEGAMFPCVYLLLAKWCPVSERTRRTAVATSGQELGTIVAMLVSPLIVEAMTWKPVFYIYGGVGCVFVPVFYFFLSANSPETDKRITEEERDYIVAHRAPCALDRVRFRDVPWVEFFKSKEFLALAYAHASFNVMWFVLINYMPSIFVSHGVARGVSLGLYTAPPYCCMALFGSFFSFICDALINRKKLTVADARAAFQSVGFLGPAAVALMISFVGLSAFSPAVLSFVFCSFLTLASFSRSGFWTNHLDLGGLFAPHMFAVTNTIAALPGGAASLLAGWGLEQLHGNWAPLFAAVCMVNTVAAVVFAKWCGGQLLPCCQEGAKFTKI